MDRPLETQSPKRAPGGSRRPAKTTTRRSHEVQPSATNRPPPKQKNEALVLKHLRLRRVDINVTEAVAQQRQSDINDLIRSQYALGVLVELAQSPPGEDGLYGSLQGARLAELLRPEVDALIAFQMNQGVIPTMIQEYRLRMQVGMLPVAPSVQQQTEARPAEPQLAHMPVVEVAEEVGGILDMFFSPHAKEEGE